MDLILWRHGDEAEHGDDLRRPLTLRGTRQARTVAEWLRKRTPKDARVLVGPALRTQQTGEALGLPVEVCQELGPKRQAGDLLAASGWPNGSGKRRGTLVMVGHQPALGEFAALLLGGSEDAWTIRKGCLWWFSQRVREGETRTVLRAVITPDLIDP
jgi:phosphohistidine phosphatase